MNKINWINGQAGGTPLSAENLNLMQDNIEEAIDDVANYSEEEVVVGKWTDGKPIYRKIFQIGSLPDDTTRFIPHNINNFKRPIKMEFFWYDSVDNRWYANPRYGANDVRIIFTCNTTDIIVQAVGANWGYRTSDCIGMVEYTKTTD